MSHDVDARLLTDQQLMLLGYDVPSLRAVQDEMEAMGLGLRISLKGVGRAIGKGVKAVGKVAAKAAPVLLPAAVATGVGVPVGVLAAKKLVPKIIEKKKKPELPTPTVVDVAPAPPTPEAARKPLGELAKRIAARVAEKEKIYGKEAVRVIPPPPPPVEVAPETIIEKAAPVVAEVLPRLLPTPAPALPAPVAPAAVAEEPATVVPRQAGIAGALPLLALGGLALMMMARKRR